MNIEDIAQNLLTYFSPEERSIPEDPTYPGRNAAVRKAINDALQDLFGKGQPWVRHDSRGAILYAPVAVAVAVVTGSSIASIKASDYANWFGGCTVVIDGADVDNQFRDNGTVSNPYPEGTLILSGGLSGFNPVTTRYHLPDPLALEWIGDDSEGFPTYQAVTESGVTISLKRGDFDGSGYPGWVLKLTGGTTSGLWYNPAQTASPLGLTGWEYENGAQGQPVLENSTPIYSYRMKFPYAGITGTHTARIYHDSIDLDDDVLEVHEPVRFDRQPLQPMNNPVAGGIRRASQDYGFSSDCCTPSADPSAAQSVGRPCRYQVGTWLPPFDQAPKIRMRLFPAPASQGFLEYDVMLTPPSVSDIGSNDPLPIPFNFIESILLPIAVKKLRVCPFWRGIIGDDDVNRNYQDALDALAASDPQKRSGLNFVWKI